MKKVLLKFFKLRNRFIKAYDEGWLPVFEGHEIHYYQVGNPKGEVVIQFHGGPGSATSAVKSCIYNLKKQRVILFDQRGCGQSKYENAFYKNTTQDTLKDANRLLNFLGVKDKVVSAGGSFGSTLAILFAETYPEKVKRICVNSVFLARPHDFENMTPVSALFYPDALSEVRNQVLGDNVHLAYQQLIFSEKKENQEKALRYLRRLEYMTASGALKVDFPQKEATEKDIQQHKVMMHYVVNNMFLEPNQLIQNADIIKYIPTEIYHNRLDFCCPVYQAWELHQALPNSKLTIVPDRGHGSNLMRYLIYQNNKKRQFD